MKISEIAVKNYQFTLVVFLFLAAMGIYSFVKIPQAEDPEFPISIFPVIAVYPGASPADIEQLVVDKIEKSLNELDDIERIKTEIKDGVAVLVVEFPPESDPDKKYDEISRQINSVRASLPADLYSIETLKIQAGNTNIVQSALVSQSDDYEELRKYAQKLEDLLTAVPGVKKAGIFALPEKELRISVDLARMAHYGLSVSRVTAAIQSGNANIPGGSIDLGHGRFNVRTGSAYRTASEVAETVVGAASGKLLYLRDIATVEWAEERARYLGRHNGERAVFIVASMKEKQIIHDVRDRIYDVYASFETDLPPGIRLERGFDQAENVRNKLSRLEKDFIFAFLLVLITLMPLGFRASGIVMLSIPLSLLIGITGLYLAGFSINQLTIVGAVISLGLLVDDSIVVVENISRWIREGTSPLAASVQATKQIGVAVIGCTATLILAFLPLMFLPGMAGKYMRSLPASVTFIVLGSLFVALTVIPFVASRILKEGADRRGNKVLRGLHKVIDYTYGRALKWSLENPLKTVTFAGLLFIFSLGIVKLTGFSLFPKAGLPQFYITVETPRGSNISETDRAVRHVESILSDREEIKYFMSNTGKGNPQIFYNSFQKSEESVLGEILCEIKREHLKDLDLFIAELRDTLSTYVNARFYVTEFENGMPVDAPVALRIVGSDLDSLKLYAGRFEELMKGTDGTLYTKNPLSQSLTEIRIDVNKEKAGLLGVPLAEIDRTVRLALAGLEAGRLRDDEGMEYPVRIILEDEGRDDFSKFERIFVSSVSGQQIPLNQLAVIGFAGSPTLIQHYNKERSITVSAGVIPGYNTDRVTKEIIQKAEKIRLPDGFRFIPAGELESRRESFSGIGSAILIAIFGIFAVLILEFGTFRSTLIVLSVIPLGIIGGLTLLWLTGYDLSFAAAVGFVALIGIEIKNSILLVDFTNQLRRQGLSINESVLKAGEIRFLPVLLTTLTAIGGLLPIALSGSGLYAPLAYVIIGGLVTSTLLARLVTPVMYKLIPPEV